MMKRILKSVRTILKESSNAGHDVSHALRVRDLCIYIAGLEGGDIEVLEASALLHDIGRPVEFKDPEIDHATISAQLAPGILGEAGFPVEKIPSVVYAVSNHRYSSGVKPVSLEARILQDADRLDISGAVGVALTFAYSGACDRKLYHLDDPLAEYRELDDNKYALDHVLSKLMLLPQSMHTMTARNIAQERNRFLRDFVKQFIHEITFSRRM